MIHRQLWETIHIRVLHQPIRPDHATRKDGAGRLGGAIAGAEDGQDDGAGTAHGSEEGLSGWVSGQNGKEGCRLGEDGRHRPGCDRVSGYRSGMERLGIDVPSVKVDDVHGGGAGGGCRNWDAVLGVVSLRPSSL